jgi:hypothetical protein
MFSLVALGFVACGCTAYTKTEIDLTSQAAKGLTLVRQSQVDHAALATRLNDLQRKRLDDAFDEDVRQSSDLSPDWVIDHRKAYAVGLDALNAQKAASVSAAVTMSSNLDTIETVLQQLLRLQQARLNLESNLSPEKK